MKPIRAYLLGLVGCFVGGFIWCIPSNLYNLLCIFVSPSLRRVVPDFTLSHGFLIFTSAHIFECFVGGLVAGFLAKKKGVLISAFVAYSFLLIEYIIFLCSAKFAPFFSLMAAKRLATGFEINLHEMLYVTALMLGTLGGKVGETLSKRYGKRTPA